MESRRRLKERLVRMFRASTLLRSTCNSTSSTSIFSSSAAATSSRSLSTDIAHDPVFIPLRRATDQSNDSSLFFLRESLDRSLSYNSMVKKKKKERRVRETGGFYETEEGEGRMCPPASPSDNYYCSKNVSKNKSITKKTKKLLSNGYGFTSSSSMEDDDGFGFFSSDDDGGGYKKEEEAEALFSSRSFSSDSSEFYQWPSSKTKKKKKKKKEKSSWREGFRPVVSISNSWEEGGRGFAVRKKSRNPYADFRWSMVEMIVERQLFGERELESLLRSYISLNSPHHHPVILRAFADIWEVLFAH